MLKSLSVKLFAGMGIGMLMLVIFLGPGAFSAYACGVCNSSECTNKPPIACSAGVCWFFGEACGNCACLLNAGSSACECR